MIVIDTSVLVDRPVILCFDFVARGFFEHLRRWNTAVVELKRLTDGPVAVGTKGREVQRIRGKDYGRTFEVIELNPDAVFAVKAVGPEGPERHYLCRYTFTPQDGKNCRITQHFELDWSGLGFTLFKPFVRRRIAKDLEMAIERRLKASIEEMAEPSGIMVGSQPMVVRPTRGPSKD
ncbi:MAG TPA: SRPBCC family protein [Myxococcaceae bacterium]|nr:SRPBCC family protein [Myxococcaceae bacterium]